MTEWEGDLPIEHLNRCKLRDNLLYADIFNEDGSHRASWRCCKREGHDGPCSSHNDCGVMNGHVVCGLLPGHSGPHAWATEIRVGAPATSQEKDRQHMTTIHIPWVYLSLGSTVDGGRPIFYKERGAKTAQRVGLVTENVEVMAAACQRYNDAMNAEYLAAQPVKE